MSSDGGAYFKFLTEHSVDVIVRSGMDRVLQYVSPSSLRVLGWDPGEMEGMVIDDFILLEDLPLLEAVIAKGEDTVVVRMRQKDGSAIWMENRATLVCDPITGKPSEWVVTLRDITERKKFEAELTTLALTDGLTGLANRRAFDTELDREWKRTLREGTQISLLLLDIDHFKDFNDQYGHQVGDDCLRSVAHAVLRAVRSTDKVARYGGEEIAVILPSTEIEGAVEVAEKVRAAIGGLLLPHQGNLEGFGQLTASVGTATAMARLGGSIKMPESLLLAADNALYKAKHNGRNCVATSLLLAAGGAGHDESSELGETVSYGK